MLKRVLFAASLALVAQTVGAQGLPDEIQARQAGDAQLQKNINAEAAARTAADTQLQGNISNEAAARSAADSQLQNSINAEAAARAAAATMLQNNIAAEANARSSADSELDGRINAEAVSRMQAIQELRNLIGSGGGGGAGGGGPVTVNCDAGESIANALAAGAAHIIVRGTCAGPVVINRDDVILGADPAGGAIQGNDPNVNTLLVTGHRVTVEGLTITGGRNGITGVGASNLTVRNVTVRTVGRTGIAYAYGSSGTVDGCVLQSNARDGFVADAAFARVTNCNISGNARHGILYVNAASGTIGVTERFAAAGNTIQNNGASASGIFITLGSTASVAMNQITGNGTGIGVFYATASIAGGNTISGNPTGGIVMTNSRVLVGDPGPLPLGASTVNTIQQNGNPMGTGGIFAGLGTSLLLRDAQIVSNNGAGLNVSLRSQVQMSGTTIRDNGGDGIRLGLGSALLPLSPVNTVTGNRASGIPSFFDGYGINCFDPESSVINVFPPVMVLSGNQAGSFAPTCTMFDSNPLPAMPF